MSAVFGVIALAILVGIALNVPTSTGTSTFLSPKYSAALWNAACAVTGSTISGAVTSGFFLRR